MKHSEPWRTVYPNISKVCDSPSLTHTLDGNSDSSTELSSLDELRQAVAKVGGLSSISTLLKQAAKCETAPQRQAHLAAAERQMREELEAIERELQQQVEQRRAAHEQRKQQEQAQTIAQAVQAAISDTPKPTVAEPEEIPVKIGRIREMWGDPIGCEWKTRQAEFSESAHFAHCKAGSKGDYFPSRLLKVCQAKGYRFTRLDTPQSSANSAFTGGATVHRLR